MPDDLERKGVVQPVDLRANLSKVAKAFLFDEKLQRIITGPLLLPQDLNVINTQFIGPAALDTGVEQTLDGLISKYIPPELNRESVLTTEGISNLRRLSLLVRLAGDLHGQSGLNLDELLQEVDIAVSSQDGLDALVSSEEMYRVRNHRMDPNVANFPESVRDSNPQLKLEPAYDGFVRNLKAGMQLKEAAVQMKSQYANEHTTVTFEPAKISGLKPVYGMVGA